MNSFDITRNRDGSYTVSEHENFGSVVIGFIMFCLIMLLVIHVFGGAKSTHNTNDSESSFQTGSTQLGSALVETSEPKALNMLKFIDTNWGVGEGNYSKYSVTDLYGNEYLGYFDLAACDCPYNLCKEAYVRLAANGNWKHLSGTFFPRNWEYGNYFVMLSIYADDDLVYESNWMDLNSKPASFNVNIDFCSVIKMSVTSQRTNSLPYTTPGLCVVDATVYN